MIPFDPIERLTPEEEQFLKDNKSSHLMQVILKCIKITYQTQSYIEHVDAETDPHKLAYHKGKLKGTYEVFNFIKSKFEDLPKKEAENVNRISPKAIRASKEDAIKLRRESLKV